MVHKGVRAYFTFCALPLIVGYALVCGVAVVIAATIEGVREAYDACEMIR